MTAQKEMKLAVFGDLQETTIILLTALRSLDQDKAYEAISILLMQGLERLGADSTAMEQFFPVWDSIQSDIDRLDFARALRRAETWETQLREIISIVRQN